MRSLIYLIVISNLICLISCSMTVEDRLSMILKSTQNTSSSTSSSLSMSYDECGRAISNVEKYCINKINREYKIDLENDEVNKCCFAWDVLDCVFGEVK